MCLLQEAHLVVRFPVKVGADLRARRLHQSLTLSDESDLVSVSCSRPPELAKAPLTIVSGQV
jgi:hypothetical protein